MFIKAAVLCLSTIHFYSVAAQGECTDLRGRLISNGLHYVPGPDTCTLCVCDNGLPKVCKAVLCSPPQDCRSFRVGSTCCEFICLDDVVKPAQATEADMRVAALVSGAVLLLVVAVIVLKVKHSKRHSPPHMEDQRSLTSIGYISGSMGYMGGGCESTALGGWKPPYLPRGEAPPPYDEAMAQCRPEPARAGTDAAYHRTYAEARDDVCASHAYVNLPRPLAQIANTQNCYNAPLLQPVHPAEARETAVTPHPLAPNMGGAGGARLTGSLGAISARLSVPRDDHERPHNVPGFYATHTALHRTIPRISTAVDTSTLEAMGLGFTRADRSLQGEVRRSFHRPVDRADRIDRIERASTGRSVPRNLNIASTAATAGAQPEPQPQEADVLSLRSVGGRAHALSDEQDVKPKPQPEAPHADHPTLPLTVDKPSCVCSYAGSARAEDADDYRSECENCHSAASPRWQEAGDGAEGSGWGGTQTLQRRAPPPPAPPPATATLPQPVTRHGRNTIDNPSNWENWFNTIPDSDSESEEE